MSAVKPMTALRRPMPGMPAVLPPAPATTPDREPHPATDSSAVPVAAAALRRRTRSTTVASASRGDAPSRRHPVEDYATTHLTNFRLPVDLHARYGRLLAQAQEQHPRLRKLSLTEVVIALLAEGPQTPDEVAELVRRKRADEHSEEVAR